jgi:rare lipoprotein A
LWSGLAAALLAAAGCHHAKKQAYAPPPPLQGTDRSAHSALDANEPFPPNRSGKNLGRIPVTPVPPGGVDDDDLQFITTHDPIRTMEGLATWYRAPYKGRKSANGQVFDENALTAAHRTLPMGSLIVVTNLKNGKSSAMRVTDRGPFAQRALLDLTEASAKATGVYPGSARVRIDVYRTPKPMDTGGRWCVQFGALSHEDEAIQLKAQLQRRYPEASVIEFPGENAFWVRIRPEGDDRGQAEYIARHTAISEGAAYLTRLD